MLLFLLCYCRTFLTSNIPDEVQFFAWAPEGSKLVSKTLFVEILFDQKRFDKLCSSRVGVFKLRNKKYNITKYITKKLHQEKLSVVKRGNFLVHIYIWDAPMLHFYITNKVQPLAFQCSQILRVLDKATTDYGITHGCCVF